MPELSIGCEIVKKAMIRELAGEEPRPAAEVTHAVAGLHVPLGEPVGMVQEPAEVVVRWTPF